MQFSRSWWYRTYKGISSCQTIVIDITSVTTWLSETGIKAATSVSTVSTNGYTTIGRHKDGHELEVAKWASRAGSGAGQTGAF
nr:hypothetical protein [Tanacetum cinerariifolium]